MQSGLVSIITPTYNQERYIAACVESVLAQSYPNWEQIIVDDGSSDGTAEVIGRYRDPRIRYICLPHRGLGALAETYNAALAASRGELVGVLEGDDVWPADKLEKQVPAFERPEVYLSWGRGALIDGSGQSKGEHPRVRTAEKIRCFDRREVFRRLTRLNVLTPSITVMVRRSALDRIGGFKQTGSSLFVDLPTWLWLTATTPGRVCFVNAVLGEYRQHSQQTTRRHGALMHAEHLKVVLELERVLDPAVLRAAGWNSGVRHAALVRGLLVEAMGELATQHFLSAFRRFSQALVRANNLNDRAMAALGMASVMARRDLFSAAQAVRNYAFTSAHRLLSRRT